ncbi:hypothetical protein AVEN_227462-1 [Araneus ventricosus]|uniref:Uncharacterized protein n=1 Tax=Araneus ventricosus TaxID=182803 RepID=A0A4Y2C3L9_ARAVE|nr:hypothetical protein AVEN_227462-1 [Araneus ventricosus]
MTSRAKTALVQDPRGQAKPPSRARQHAQPTSHQHHHNKTTHILAPSLEGDPAPNHPQASQAQGPGAKGRRAANNPRSIETKYIAQ